MALDRDIELLTAVPFFEGVPSDALKLIAFSSDPRVYGERERIFSAGEAAEGGLLLIDGQIDLVDEQKKPPRPVERLPAGTLIGELALITETRRPLSGISVGSVRLLVIRRALFRRMLEGYPEIARLLESRIAEGLSRLAPEIARIGDAFDAIDRPV